MEWDVDNNLISAEDLHRALHRPGIRIFDSRFDLSDSAQGHREYLKGHIPSALFCSISEDLAEAPGSRGRHPLPARSKFVQTVQRWGISNSSHVIVYDANNSMFAGRLWWMMRWLGHQRVSVLDGGIAAWNEAGFETTTDIPEFPVSEFQANEPLTKLVTADELLNFDGVLIDARARDRFRGLNETIDHTSGHIPGARCSPCSENIGNDGRFTRDPSKFSFVNNDANVVCYCGSGISANSNILAMLVSGYPEPALYPGSWSEWIEDSSRPVER